jgi:hypothetical protein
LSEEPTSDTKYEWAFGFTWVREIKYQENIYSKLQKQVASQAESFLEQG